jgi:DNA-binding response OmpR family regulator
MARVLLAEDDDGIREPMARALLREGYEVDAVADGEEAARRALDEALDLLVLDIGLPGLDGLEVCRRVRRAQPTLPILMVTAQDDEMALVEGLDAGADDYVTKPFRLAELLARVRALLRRAGAAGETGELDVAGVHLEPASRRVRHGAEDLDLTPKEFDLLEFLLRSAGAVVRRERIMSEVWGENWFGSTKTLDMHISSLRRKLGDDAADPRLLTTVRGIGFRFEA